MGDLVKCVSVCLKMLDLIISRHSGLLCCENRMLSGLYSRNINGCVVSTLLWIEWDWFPGGSDESDKFIQFLHFWRNERLLHGIIFKQRISYFDLDKLLPDSPFYFGNSKEILCWCSVISPCFKDIFIWPCLRWKLAVKMLNEPPPYPLFYLSLLDVAFPYLKTFPPQTNRGFASIIGGTWLSVLSELLCVSRRFLTSFFLRSIY